LRSKFLEGGENEEVLLRILGAFYLYEEEDFASCNRKLYRDVLIFNSVSLFLPPEEIRRLFFMRTKKR